MRATVDEFLTLYDLPEDVQEKLKASLEIANPAYARAARFGGAPKWAITIPPKITLWSQRGTGIAVPRGLPITPKTGLVGLALSFKDCRAIAPVVFPTFKIKLYDWQDRVGDLILDDAQSAKPQRRWGNYLIVKPVSAGKTIAGASFAAKLGQRTLVLVHTKEIFRAWLNDLPSLFGDEIDIGTFGGGRKNCRVGKHFTIATIQKLGQMSEEDRFELYGMFGCVIQDECHHAPAASFYNVVHNIPAKYRIGITGTKERSDGLQSILYRVFGKPFYEEKDDGEETESSLPITDVIIRHTDLELPEKRPKAFRINGKTVIKMIDTDEGDHVYAQQLLAQDPERDEVIIKDVLEQLRSGNHACLVVTSRVEHAQRLYDKIQERTGWKGALLLGTTSIPERDRINLKIYKRELRWVVATYLVIYEGASIRPLDRLFVAFSAVDPSLLRQLFGRMRRKFPGKHDVYVYDYADMNVPALRAQHIKRCAVYREMKIKRFVNRFTG